MILTEAYFQNIQATIQKELLMAKRTVYAAVAWFTDEVLFNTLIQIQQKNVHVQLCIVEDQINFRANGLPFKQMIGKYGKLSAIAGDKMHHKFCVIDESVVITGSYNWTYKAANTGKDENIIVTSGDFELAQKFIQEFLKITGQEYANVPTDINKVLKRCKAILNLIQLDEVEDVHKQAQRLKTEAPFIETVLSISEHLLQNKFASAIEEISELLSKYQSLQIYKDPLINALKLEIKLLEYQIIALENEKADAEKKVFNYDRLFNEVLGETLRQYLELKRRFKQQIKEENPKSTTAQKDYEEAETDYKEFKNSYEETKQQAEEFIQMNSEDFITLKKMYREAATLVHPDKHMNNPEKYKKAEQLFKELNDAYQKQDIEKVKIILQNLKQGIFDLNETNTKTNDVRLLKYILQQLQKKYEQLIAAIEEIKNSEAYNNVLKEENLKDYFNSIKNDIEQRVFELQKQLKLYEQQ